MRTFDIILNFQFVCSTLFCSVEPKCSIICLLVFSPLHGSLMLYRSNCLLFSYCRLPLSGGIHTLHDKLFCLVTKTELPHCDEIPGPIPSNKVYRPNVALMLVHHLRRWPNINPLGAGAVFIRRNLTSVDVHV